MRMYIKCHGSGWETLPFQAIYDTETKDLRGLESQLVKR